MFKKSLDTVLQRTLTKNENFIDNLLFRRYVRKNMPDLLKYGENPDEIVKNRIKSFEKYPQLSADQQMRNLIIENLPKTVNIHTSDNFIALLKLFTYENLYNQNPSNQYINDLQQFLNWWKNEASFPTDKNKEIVDIMEGLVYKSPVKVIKIFYETKCITPEMDKSVTDFINVKRRHHSNLLEKCNAHKRLDISQYLLTLNYIDQRHLPTIWKPRIK